ncbi:unnamed protein product, partial [Ectocarpus fasciculatus]
MSRLQTEHHTQSLREVHERLVSFVQCHTQLASSTIGLADAILDFYSPEDAGFAPAVAFQTVAAEGVSGLLCAQLQALVQTALRPLARFTAELGEMDTLSKACRRKRESENHYARKVNELNGKLEAERREDKRAVLQEKAARNIQKLAAARTGRKQASDELSRLVVSSHQSSQDCFNPVFASICQFQEASYSHGHLLASMLLRVVRSSLGTTALPMATAGALNAHTTAPPSPLPEGRGEGVLKWRDDGSDAGDSGAGVAVGGAAAAATAACAAGGHGGDGEDGATDAAGNGGGGGAGGARPEETQEEKRGDSCSPRRGTPRSAEEDGGGGGGGGGGADVEGVADRAAGTTAAVGGGAGGAAAAAVAADGAAGVADASATADAAATAGAAEANDTANATAAVAAAATDAAAADVTAAAAAAGCGGGGGDNETPEQGEDRPDAPAGAKTGAEVTPPPGAGGDGGGSGGVTMPQARPTPPQGPFLEAHLPWGKRRRMSGNLRLKISGGGRVARRVVFCAAEGRELVVYDAESDSNAGLPPRARYLVMGVRAVKTGPNAAELEV